ncbi:MAG: hypothetical protein ACW97O_07245, partial [Candidatus Thorarchaeota archaeon]
SPTFTDYLPYRIKRIKDVNRGFSIEMINLYTRSGLRRTMAGSRFREGNNNPKGMFVPIANQITYLH